MPRAAVSVLSRRVSTRPWPRWLCSVWVMGTSAQGRADQLRGGGLGVHRVHRDQQPHPAEDAEQPPYAGNFVALAGHRELAEDQPGAVGKHRHQVHRHGPGAAGAAQRLAVQRDRQRPTRGGGLGSHPRGEVGPQPAVQVGGIQPRQHSAKRLLTRPPQPHPQPRQHILRSGSGPGREPGVAAHSRRDREDRNRQQRHQRIPPPAPIPRIRHRGQHIQQLGAQHLRAVPGPPAIQCIGDRRLR